MESAGRIGVDHSASNLLHQIISRTAGSYPEKTALLHRGDGVHFRSTTYRELLTSVARATSVLADLGIERGDRVALLAQNGPLWVVADLAILSRGAIVVPLYQTLPAPALHHILSDSGSKLIFVGNAAQRVRIESIRRDLPALRHVITLETPQEGATGGAPSFQRLVGEARAPVAGSDPATPLPATGEDIATLVYTSGTTAEPKGVALSHRNIASNIMAAIPRFGISSEDVFLSFLPACHMFERTCGHYTMLAAGATIAYAKDLTTIAADVRIVRPTIIIAVPRIIEKIYEAVAARVAESSPLRRHLVASAIRVLNEYTNREYRGESIPRLLRWKRAVLDRLVAAKFREISGGRLRLLVSGGAALDRRLAKTLWVLGFKILQGYGLTEAAPLVCASTVEENRLGTVGGPFDGVEVRLGEDREILVRGPNVMVGYYRKPEETRRAIDPEGWLHTGDVGSFDERGNLTITGRLKELIVTSYGKNIVPGPIEAALLNRRYIEEVMLYGDGRKFVTALIVPDRRALEAYAEERHIAATNYPALLREPAIATLLDTEVSQAMAPFADYERVKRFTLLPEGFSLENGLLTPTLKLRRASIAARYRREIGAMYETSN